MIDPITLSRPLQSVAAQWLMVLPATILLGAAALRMLQPPQHEPARAISLMVEMDWSAHCKIGSWNFVFDSTWSCRYRWLLRFARRLARRPAVAERCAFSV